MRKFDPRVLGLVTSLAGLPGCAAAPATALDGEACKTIHAQAEPDLMAWDPGTRGSLAGVREQGIAVVRYEGEGCNARLEVLSNCLARGTYQFVPYWESESKIARNAKELFSTLPLGAANLTGKLHDQRALRTDYMLAGMAQIPIGVNYGVGDLVGDCSRATHLVTRMYLGGFALVSGESTDIEASTSVFALKAGTKVASSLERVQSAGDADACLESRRSRSESAACSIPLRLTLMPLARTHECESFAECETACNAGEPAGCNMLGVMYADGRGAAQDFARSAAAFKKSCEHGDPAGCGNLGVQYLNGHGVPQDFLQARHLLDNACRHEVAWGCGHLGSMLAQGLGGTVDLMQAAELYQTACRGSDAAGCAAALGLLESLCQQDNGHACLDLGQMHQQGLGTEASAPRSFEIYQRGCTAGDADSCLAASEIALTGPSGTRDVGRGIAILENACSRGFAKGCSRLGIVYIGIYGDIVAVDNPRAVALFQRACDGGDDDGCSGLGLMYEEGRGTAVDLQRALSLYKDACDSGNRWGCSGLASLYEDGKGVRQDVGQAKLLYRKACESGDDDSCRALERIGN